MWVLAFHYVLYIVGIELRWSSLAGKHLYLLRGLSLLVCIEINLKRSKVGFPAQIRQVACFNYACPLSSTAHFQDSVGPRVSWMWMNVQALLAGTVPSVWTSLTAMSVAVQRVRLDRETGKSRKVGWWADGCQGPIADLGIASELGFSEAGSGPGTVGV